MDRYIKQKIKSKTAWVIAFILATAWLLVTALPFIYMVMNSFKGQFEMLKKGVFQPPDSWYPTNYINILSRGFMNYFLHSVIVLVISLSILLFITACASYPLSRMRFKLRNLIYAFIIAGMSIPIHVTLIPVFKMSTRAGIYDTLWALIGPNIAFAIPIACYILTSFMASIPSEVEESAEIDGCNKFRNFFSVILPLSKTGLSTLAIYNGVAIWNEFSFANTLTQSKAAKTLPLAIQAFQGEHSMNIPVIMSVLVLTVLPMIVLFSILQERLVKGLMAGAVKG
jgi:raffinose/stachyose/melibiose transport system permease protein